MADIERRKAPRATDRLKALRTSLQMLLKESRVLRAQLAAKMRRRGTAPPSDDVDASRIRELTKGRGEGDPL